MSDQSPVAADVREFLEQVVRSGEFSLEVNCSIEEKEVRVELAGADSGLLLRDSARLLLSLNHLVNQAFFRRYGDEYSYVLDSRDYRKTREKELMLMAEAAAEEVRRSRQKVSLQAMPAADRRIIHLALSGAPGVRTMSDGGGFHRHVVILPS